jgi:hypothetical protein
MTGLHLCSIKCAMHLISNKMQGDGINRPFKRSDSLLQHAYRTKYKGSGIQNNESMATEGANKALSWRWPLVTYRDDNVLNSRSAKR